MDKNFFINDDVFKVLSEMAKNTDKKGVLPSLLAKYAVCKLFSIDKIGVDGFFEKNGVYYQVKSTVGTNPKYKIINPPELDTFYYIFCRVYVDADSANANVRFKGMVDAMTVFSLMDSDGYGYRIRLGKLEKRKVLKPLPL